jgi:hypothetical protein
MRHASLVAAVALLLVNSAPAFDAVGTIKKVDTDKGVLFIHANGQDRTVKIDKEVKVLDADGKPLADGLKSKELKEGAEITVTVDRGADGPVIKAIRLGKGQAVPAKEGKASVGLKPLTEMTADDRYKGEDGGLYGGGKNEPTGLLLKAARDASAKIQPLDADGKPAREGTIALISISMSNATQEFSMFKQLADRDEKKSPRVTVVDCAQGGQAMAQWVDPKARAWVEADRRLEAAKVSPMQVQVIWVKLANIQPKGELADHGKKLKTDTAAVLKNAKDRFPNLRVAYLGSRIYGGWATTPLNPEPYAYESAFVVRWLIQDQLKVAELNSDKAPVLLWGPYLWADGTTPRKSDGLVYERSDLAGDGTHPSQSGRRKVADLLLKFFQTHPLASKWYLK